MFSCIVIWSLLIISRSEFSGGEGSVHDQTRNAYSRIVRNVSSSQHRRDFHVGNSFFNENWVMAPASTEERDGLGPYFNTVSCSSCHFKDGRGLPFPDQGLLLRVGHNSNKPDSKYGFQLQTSAIEGLKAEGKFRSLYEEFIVEFPDAHQVKLRKPKIELFDMKFGPLDSESKVSPRIAAAVFGSGLLEAIDEKDILAKADPDDLNKDGISGRIHFVSDLKTGKKVVGRFGWKANQPDIRHQNAAAFHGDLGLTSSLHPKENCAHAEDEGCRKAPHGGEPEISDRRLEQMTTYIRLLAVPAARDLNHPEVVQGEKLFKEIGCESCHASEWTTGILDGFPELSHQKIYPFTDLLLHDMGEALSDGKVDGDASPREWKTPPLWGLGLLETVNNHSFLLHDGRARSVEEAILWHGGEAEASKNAYIHLSAHERAALLKFLKSL